MNVRKIVTISLIVAIVLTLAFIWSNSLTVGKKSNSKSMQVTEKVQSVIDPDKTIPPVKFNVFVRKSAHVFEFMLLGLELMLLKIISRKPQIFTVLFIILASAVADEFIQSFSDRTDLVSDVLIDFSGALFAILIIQVVYVVGKKYICRRNNAI